MFRRFVVAHETESTDALSMEQLDELEESSTIADESQVGNQCSVCLESIQENARVITLPCNHFFHSNCILRWYAENPTCPICRHNHNNDERDINNRIQLSFNSLYMMTTQVKIILKYPNNVRQESNWSIHDTLIDIFKFIERSCSNRSNIVIQNESHVFKTTESYTSLNQALIMHNIFQETEFFVTFF